MIQRRWETYNLNRESAAKAEAKKRAEAEAEATARAIAEAAQRRHDDAIDDAIAEYWNGFAAGAEHQRGLVMQALGGHLSAAQIAAVEAELGPVQLHPGVRRLPGSPPRGL